MKQVDDTRKGRKARNRGGTVGEKQRLANLPKTVTRCFKCKSRAGYTNPCWKCEKCRNKFCFDCLEAVIEKDGVKNYCKKCR